MIAAPVAENKLCCACAVSSISRSVISPSAINSVRLLATKEFGDRFRSGWVLACILVWLGAIGLTSFLGLLQIGRIGVLGYERTVISLLNLVQYLVPLLGLLLGHDLPVPLRAAVEKSHDIVVIGNVHRRSLRRSNWIG